MAGPSAELLEAVNELAAINGWSPQDILTIYSYETGGTLDPWQKGPTTKWGEHRGLIQWGEPQRQKYGVTADSSVRDQVMASGEYWKDRGAQPGMGILPLYAAVNAGNVNNVNASDEAAGGAPGTVIDKVNNQMEGHRRNAYMWTGQDYVPAETGGWYGNNAQDVPEPPVPDLTNTEQFIVDMKGGAKDMMAEGVKSLIFGTGTAPMPPPPPLPAPPPMMSSSRPAGPIQLRKETKRQ